MVYLCDKCNKKFTSLNGFEYHIHNNVCDKRKFICVKCGQSFTSKQNLNYHIKHKVCSKEPIENDQLLSEISKLKKENNILKSHPQIINQNITQQNITQQNITQFNIVFPCAFGKENISVINSKIGGDVLGKLIKHHTSSYIPELFTTIHKNDKLPEYHNVFVSNEHSWYAMVSDGRTFNHKPPKTIIDQIIEDKRSLLNQYVDDHGELLGDKVLQKYEKYQDQIDSDSEFRKSLELEIGGLLLDMKSVIANDEKTQKLLDKLSDGKFDLTYP